ncbi:unnamed protein product [Sphagnum balticum]
MVVPVVNAKEACNKLTPDFYSESCPQLEHIVQTVVKAAVLKETRMAASLMRLEFHDCFLLIVAKNFRDVMGHCCWMTLPFHRSEDQLGLLIWKEGQHYSQLDIGQLGSAECSHFWATAHPKFRIKRFQSTATGSTFRWTHNCFARCAPIAPSLYGPLTDENSMNTAYHTFLEKACPNGSAPSLIPLDDGTPGKFDSSYYTKLLEGNGALHSDRIMIDESGRTVLEYVSLFAKDQECFFNDFAKAMVVMGRLQPLTGSKGQIRTNCHFVNPPSKLKTISKTFNHKLPLHTPAADLHP